MANKSSLALYQTIDGVNYNSGYSQASANTIAKGVQDDIVGRVSSIPSGGIFDLNEAAATFAKTHNREIIADLSLTDRTAVYAALKSRIWAPLYASSDETTFNLMKGYTGAYLYSQYEWFNPGEDISAWELYVLQAGSAVYQIMDFIVGDDWLNEAFTDWWEQGVGLKIAYWQGIGNIPDAVKGKHVSLTLPDAFIDVAAGYDPITGELYVYSNEEGRQSIVDNSAIKTALTGRWRIVYSGTPNYTATAIAELTSDYGGYEATVAVSQPQGNYYGSGGWSGQGLTITPKGEGGSGPFDITLTASYLVGGIGDAPDFYVYPTFSTTSFESLPTQYLTLNDF